MKKLLILIVMLFSYLGAEVFNLSHEDAQKIGKRIWQNECNGTLEGLISWHANEKFPSLAIGHFIWFPESAAENYIETFPSFIHFLKDNKVLVPNWLMKNNKVIACPWHTKKEFDKEAASSPKMKELRALVERTIDYQVRFIIDRFKQTLDNVLKHAHKKKQAHIRKQLKRLMASSQGLYVIIDYVNFKGSGLSTSEKYGHHGWGLLQVLEGMNGDGSGMCAIEEFIQSAKKVLELRVAHSPKEKKEDKFLAGWHNRLNNYLIKL